MRVADRGPAPHLTLYAYNLIKNKRGDASDKAESES